MTIDEIVHALKEAGARHGNEEGTLKGCATGKKSEAAL